jgi:hypothetical protein
LRLPVIDSNGAINLRLSFISASALSATLRDIRYIATRTPACVIMASVIKTTAAIKSVSIFPPF